MILSSFAARDGSQYFGFLTIVTLSPWTRLSNRNGPVPVGCSAIPGVPYFCQIDGLLMPIVPRPASIIPPTNSLNGPPSSKRTVFLSTTTMFFSFDGPQNQARTPAAFGSKWGGFVRPREDWSHCRSTFHLTASASNGVPSV